MACECEEPGSSQDINNPKLHHIVAFLDEEHDTLRADILARTTQTGLTITRDRRQRRAEEARLDYRLKQWHNVVEYCSDLNVTNEMDLLPALAALAAQYQRLRKSDIYLAGLWKSSLVEDLIWFPTLVDTRRQDRWVSLSWSWVSV